MKRIPIFLCTGIMLASVLVAGAAPALAESVATDPPTVTNDTMTTDGSAVRFCKDLDLPDPSKYEGMTEEERQAAMQADLKAALDKKVAAGELTQEQADDMLQRFADKTPPEGGMRGGKGGMRFSKDLDLPDPSKYKDMTEEERQAAMQADLKAALDKKVAAGELTQEQADDMLARFADKTPPEGGMRGGRGPGRFGDAPSQGTDDAATPTAPANTSSVQNRLI